MKTKTFHVITFIALSGLLFTHCTVDEIVPTGNDGTDAKTVTITLSKEIPPPLNQDGTKTLLGPDGSSVLWEETDYVCINGSIYHVTVNPENPGIATVENVEAAEEYIVSTNDITQTDTTVIVYMNTGGSSRTYRDGSFSKNCPMVGYGTTTDIEMKQVASIIRIAMTGIKEGQTLRSISFAPNDRTLSLAGDIAVPISDLKSGTLQTAYEFYNPYDTNYLIYSFLPESGETPVVLDPDTPKYLYFLVPAQEYPNGFTITYSDTEGNVGRQSLNSTISLERGTILPMAEFQFTPFKTPVVTVTGQTSSSITCEVVSEPGEKIKVGAVYKSAYDKLPEYSSTGRYALNYRMNAIGRSEYIAEADAEGKTSFTISKVNSYGGGYIAMSSETEYYVLSGYYDEFYTMVSSGMTTTATAKGTGTAPVVKITPSAEGCDYDSFAATITTDREISSLSMDLLVYKEYQTFIDSGYSDLDIIREDGRSMSAEDVTAASSTGAVFESYTSQVYPGHDFVMLVLAVSPDGMETLEKYVWTSPEHFSADAVWEDMDAEISLAYEPSEPYSYEVTNPIACSAFQKLSGSMIYRFKCNLAENETFKEYAAQYGLVPEDGAGDFYLYMDTATPGTSGRYIIQFFPKESYPGFVDQDGNKVFMCRLAANRQMKISADGTVYSGKSYIYFTSDALRYYTIDRYISIMIEFTVTLNQQQTVI